MLRLILFAASAVAQALTFPSTDPFQKYSISTPGMNATFIGYGARITSLYTNDRNGVPQDVIVGFDNPLDYLHNDQTTHSYFGPVVGRYANFIRNGTFTLNGNTYHIPENADNGTATVHGGIIGYDQRNWTVVAHNTSSITFGLYDAGLEGFPGSVLTHVTYALSQNRLTTRMVSIPLDEVTPIMFSNHIYWNLDAFTTGPGQDVLNNTLYMPYSSRFIDVDGGEVPTGRIDSVLGGPYDYTTTKELRVDNNNSRECGDGCVGIVNTYIIDRPPSSAPKASDLVVATLTSPVTGITLSVSTNQGAVLVYDCQLLNGSIPAKASQQHGPPGQTTYVEQYGCMVFETQDWIDGINHPEWGRQDYQIYAPDTEPYVSYNVFEFSIARQ